MATKQATDIRDTILEYLKADERTLGYLSTKSGIPYGTLYSIFIQRTFDLNDERLSKINEGLGTDFKS